MPVPGKELKFKGKRPVRQPGTRRLNQILEGIKMQKEQLQMTEKESLWEQ